MNLATKRAFKLAAILCGWLLFDFSFGYLVSRMGDSGLLDDGGVVLSILVLGFFGANAIFPIFLIYCRYKRRAQWILEEANEWLASRASREGGLKGKWQQRFRRGALLVPSGIALSVFLFLPQSMGIVSNLFSSRTVVLNTHRLTVPWTALNRSYRNRYLSALIGRGIAQVGLLPYWHMKPPISSVFFFAIDDPKQAEWYEGSVAPKEAASERTMPFGDETLACWQIGSESTHLQSDLVSIKCIASKHDVTASFYGARHDVTVFYQIMKGATN